MKPAMAKTQLVPLLACALFSPACCIKSAANLVARDTTATHQFSRALAAFETELLDLEVQWEQAVAKGVEIPCHIHQTAKSHDLPAKTARMVATWKDKNPECTHTLYDDAEIAAFAKQHFSNSIWTIWEHLKPVEKADAFRYMVVLKNGGFYADTDVSCLVAIKDWSIPKGIALITGYETAYELSDSVRAQVKFSRAEQVEQWFFAAAPGHPVLKKSIELLVRKWKEGKRDTLEVTGPGTFTDAVYDFFHHGPLTPDSKLDLPVHQAFGPDGQQVWMLQAQEVSNGFTAETFAGKRLIVHHFAGSWKQ